MLAALLVRAAAAAAGGAQGVAVDQAEHDQGEAERPHTSGTAGIAADDRDPDDIVEPPGKCNPRDRGTPVRSREGERRRPVACCEEAAPAVGLQGIAKEREEPGRDEQAGVAVRERPRRVHEAAANQNRQREGKRSESAREYQPAAPRAGQMYEAV
jgi:hypothetical protein